MAPIQQKVSQSLKDSLANLKGKNIKVYAYSTSAIRRGVGNFGQTFNSQMKHSQAIFSTVIGSLPTDYGYKTNGLFLRDYLFNPGELFQVTTAPFLHREIYSKKNGQTSKFDLNGFFDGDEIIEHYTCLLYTSDAADE